MTTADDTQDTSERTLGRLEGRVEELSAQRQQLNVRMDQVASDMTAGFQQVNVRIDQVASETAAGFQQVNDRMDQLNGHLNRIIGGGMLAALFGILFTLLLRGTPPA